jgi:hypothetical protein
LRWLCGHKSGSGREPGLRKEADYDIGCHCEDPEQAEGDEAISLRHVIARNGVTKQSVERNTRLPRRQKTAARNDGIKNKEGWRA